MTDQLRRRAVLAGVAGGFAGMAGCAGLGTTGPGDSGPTTTSTATETETETGTETATATATERPSTFSGATIPSYPYRETASDPLRAKPDPDALNPVLTAGHITEVNVKYVADPFLFVEDGEWHMFFEAYNDEDEGRIAYASGEEDGTVWSYETLVVDREFHVSFPQVFKWNGEYYMTTEEETPIIRLYRATKFPMEWEEATTLYNPSHFGISRPMSDHALFRWKNKWWSIAGTAGNTYLFYADSLTEGDWKSHANNPVVEDRPRASRPGGRPIVRDDHVLVFYQDVEQYYGRLVRAYRITDLSTDSFSDSEVEESPVIEPTGDGGWNSHRMHHYDPWALGDGNGWRVAVDGDNSGNDWAIGIYRAE